MAASASRRARAAKRALLFEGESDPQTCWQHNLPAFGVPGADMVNPKRLAKDFAGIERLYVGNERDRGAPGFLRSLGATGGLADRVRVIDLSPYKDPSELHVADPDGFLAAMDRAMAESVPLSEAIAKLTPAPGPGVQAVDRRTDMANAQLFVARHGGRFRFAHEIKERMEAKGTFYVWDGRRWKSDADGEIDRLAQQFLRDEYIAAATDLDEKVRKWVSASLNESYRIRMLKSAAPMLPIATTADVFDPDPWAFNTLSGIIDLRTCLPRPHDPAAMCSKLAAVEYDVGTGCPLFEQFLEDIFAGDGELISFVQRCVGYSLTGLTREQVLFLLWGGGWNGKTTLLGVLKRLFGDYSRNADFASFSYQREKQAGTRDDLAALAGARLVTAAEPTVGLRFSEGKLKEITGSDPVTARHLYGRHFDFVPQFKLWLSGNHRPTVRDTSEGFWRRICLIPFTVSFKGRADQQLAEKLIAELPGILNWALLGCLEWQRIGLQPPGVVRVATAEYRAEEDLVGTFIAERTTSDPGAVTPFRVLYESYGSWCNDRSESPVSSKAFGEALSEHGFAKTRLGGGMSARQGVGLQEV